MSTDTASRLCEIADIVGTMYDTRAATVATELRRLAAELEGPAETPSSTAIARKLGQATDSDPVLDWCDVHDTSAPCGYCSEGMPPCGNYVGPAPEYEEGDVVLLLRSTDDDAPSFAPDPDDERDVRKAFTKLLVQLDPTPDPDPDDPDAWPLPRAGLVWRGCRPQYVVDEYATFCAQMWLSETGEAIGSLTADPDAERIAEVLRAREDAQRARGVST